MMIEPGSSSVEDLLLVGHDVVAHRHARSIRTFAPVAMIRLSRCTTRCCRPCRPDAVLAALVAGEGAPAVDLGDLVLLHQVVDALGAGVGDLAAALVGRAEGHRGVALDPEGLLLLGDDVRDLGVAEQCLGGDAADVEADAAPVLLLDDPDALAELGGADRGDVATGAGTEDEDVEVGHRSRASLVVRPGATSLGTTLQPVTLYAAYGTNLDPARMGERCPHSPLRTTGWLTGWRLTFGGEEHGWDGALATIVAGPARAGLRGGLRRHPRGRVRPRRLGGRRLRALPQDQGAGLRR